jgi:hypothetical protein
MNHALSTQLFMNQKQKFLINFYIQPDINE